MKKRASAILCTMSLTASMLAGCGSASSKAASGTSAAAASTSSTASTPVTASTSSAAAASKEDTSSAASDQETVSAASSAAQAGTLADGTYTADFNTDSSMFKVNETKDGKGTLTVKNGKMTIHVSLVSENIVNLFEGTKEDAQKDGAKLIEPTVDTITYSDGTTEDVYGFDIPVPAIGKDFQVALIGTKGKWYDHTVTVTNPEPQTEDAASQSTSTASQS
ncbi:MAG: hypothetical protein LIV24_06590 [Eubacterium sp.]|nr:hypothetical protein [Eubacterium sp.]